MSMSVSASAISCGSVMSSWRKSAECSSFWHEIALYTLYAHDETEVRRTRSKRTCGEKDKYTSNLFQAGRRFHMSSLRVSRVHIAEPTDSTQRAIMHLRGWGGRSETGTIFAVLLNVLQSWRAKLLNLLPLLENTTQHYAPRCLLPWWELPPAASRSSVVIACVCVFRSG